MLPWSQSIFLLERAKLETKINEIFIKSWKENLYVFLNDCVIYTLYYFNSETDLTYQNSKNHS